MGSKGKTVHTRDPSKNETRKYFFLEEVEVEAQGSLFSLVFAAK